MTPAEPGEVGGPPSDAPQPEPPRRRLPSGRWLVLAVLLLAVALGLIAGVFVAMRGRSLDAAAGADATVRPTFVVAASPSPSPKPSASQVPSPSATQADEYVVAPGDTLRSIADRVYGDPTAWPRIYDANRAVIGADPDAIAAGQRLRIPRP